MVDVPVAEPDQRSIGVGCLRCVPLVFSIVLVLTEPGHTPIGHVGIGRGVRKIANTVVHERCAEGQIIIEFRISYDQHTNIPRDRLGAAIRQRRHRPPRPAIVATAIRIECLVRPLGWERCFLLCVATIQSQRRRRERQRTESRGYTCHRRQVLIGQERILASDQPKELLTVGARFRANTVTLAIPCPRGGLQHPLSSCVCVNGEGVIRKTRSLPLVYRASIGILGRKRQCRIKVWHRSEADSPRP